MARRILIIEDDTALSENLSKVIEKGGFESVVANDGDAGLKLAREKKPDLILTDLVLPKRHGFQILEDLQSDRELKSIPVIVLTNLETSVDIEKASSLGVKAYLVKANYSLAEILGKVLEVLDEK